MSNRKLSTAIIGMGLIGTRRAKYASEHEYSSVSIVADVNEERAVNAAKEFQCDWCSRWEDVIVKDNIDIVVVSTTNNLLLPIASCALLNGKHVLIEKPMCRNLNEALELYSIAKKSGKSLKIGFNHRYHPGIRKAYAMFKNGDIGELMYMLARYGHGGRPGYDKEWRGDQELAGGGELLDQGVHIADLINWFMGPICEVTGTVGRYFWQVEPMEDNGMAILKDSSGRAAMLHTSWTQWKNIFSFEIFGKDGYLSVSGLGGSYGIETLTWGKRNSAGGPPNMECYSFEGPDSSWRLEWNDWTSSILKKTDYMGTPEDGVNSMKIIDGIYRSSVDKKAVYLF